ncbi:MAG: hypothetical protein LQ349_006857 [Xanthoria aureola]|nr:MAG: hypothetical protein LQ349_006857 [Xanthoria aureola]
MLADVQSLEKRQEQRSRFRQICYRLEPLVSFLVTCSPTVDSMVQFDLQPFSIDLGILESYFEFIKSFLRSADVEFEDSLQSINQRYLSFQEEVTLTHRQNLENHLVKQNTVDVAVFEALCKNKRNIVGDSGNAPKTVQSILAWLEWSDYDEPLRRTKTTRTSGTGAWLVESPEFRYWLANHDQDFCSRTLWIHVAPGVGKSVICGTAIEYLQKKQAQKQSEAPTIAYFYCSPSFATRPLAWPELRTALSWNTDLQDFRPTSAPFKDAILAILCPLIEYREETDTFRLVHFSLYEYLLNEMKPHQARQDENHFLFDLNVIQGELADMTLAEIANDHTSGSISVDSDQYLFATYATKN